MDNIADRSALEDRWLTLTRATLPAVAAERGWPVRADHCFQRILLDNACDGVWYDHISGRPAYTHAPTPVLERAVQLGEAALVNTTNLGMLNRLSLTWRKKRRSASGAQTTLPISSPLPQKRTSVDA